MQAISQIVTLRASSNYHALCVVDRFDLSQNRGMDGNDKNGGPNHLRAWREYRGLTQAQLGERVGTNSNMIGYLESGERGLSAKWLRKLADALDTTSGMILDHDPNDLDSDILEIWATASNRVKRQISEMARILLRDGTNG
jgi:transcriptional regulator with XRE-family HTH domain